MKLSTYVLLSLTAILSPGVTMPVPASIDTTITTTNTMKRENHRFETAIGDTAVVDAREFPDIDVEIRDPARIESRDIPSIEVEIRDPARIE